MGFLSRLSRLNWIVPLFILTVFTWLYGPHMNWMLPFLRSYGFKPCWPFDFSPVQCFQQISPNPSDPVASTETRSHETNRSELRGHLLAASTTLFTVRDGQSQKERERERERERKKERGVERKRHKGGPP